MNYLLISVSSLIGCTSSFFLNKKKEKKSALTFMRGSLGTTRQIPDSRFRASPPLPSFVAAAPPPSPSPASSRWVLLLFFDRGMEDDSISPHERRQIEHIRALELEELQVEEVDDTGSSSDDNGCVHIYHHFLHSMLMFVPPPFFFLRYNPINFACCFWC